MLRILLAIILALMLQLDGSSQDGSNDPGPPPAEPPASLPMCHNYHDNDNVNCHCPKAMMEGGSPNGTPDPSRGQGWCSHYCHETKRCACLSPVGDHPKKNK